MVSAKSARARARVSSTHGMRACELALWSALREGALCGEGALRVKERGGSAAAAGQCARRRSEGSSVPCGLLQGAPRLLSDPQIFNGL